MPILQYSFSSGKNSSDFALVIDAMDLLYQSDIDVFYIVSLVTVISQGLSCASGNPER